MKRTILLATLVGTLVIGSASGHARAPARDGRVVGVIRLCGGPAPGGCFTQDGIVLALDAQKQIVARDHTKHAAFSFELPAGTYVLEARTGGTPWQANSTDSSRQDDHRERRHPYSLRPHFRPDSRYLRIGSLTSLWRCVLIGAWTDDCLRPSPCTRSLSSSSSASCSIYDRSKRRPANGRAPAVGQPRGQARL